MTTSIVDDQGSATPTTLRSHAYDGYEYNRHGYRWKLKHGSTELVKVTEQTAYGQSAAETYGNGARTWRSYDRLARLADIDTVRCGTKVQDNTYAWRSDGSLQRRTARASRWVRREFFAYDYLNRLTEAATHIGGSATPNRTLEFDYDRRGNLESKTSDAPGDKATTGYDYDPGTNRLSEATIGDVEYGFMPDSSGHIEQYACAADDGDAIDDCADVDDTFIGWNARGLAETVTVGESKTDPMPEARDIFHYGPDGARYFKKSEWAVESGGTTTMKTSRKYYAGAYEKTVTVGGDTVERTRIGDAVVRVKTTPAGMMASPPPPVFEYAHRDHLGSVEAVTDQAGNELIVLGHDPYGERRKNDWTGQLTDIEALLGAHGERVSRGFTRHEHLDRTGLIHMNGRMYDPRLGRFLSPDPIVGDPTSSQSWNLYSYVGNNPLSYVDPTGMYPECDWVCEEDMDAWWDWFDFLNSWWDIPHGGSEPYSGSDYQAPPSVVARAIETLNALDQSVADQPADAGWVVAIGAGAWDFVIGDTIDAAHDTVHEASVGNWGGVAVGVAGLACEVAKLCKVAGKLVKRIPGADRVLDRADQWVRGVFGSKPTMPGGLETRGVRPAAGTRVRPEGVPEGWRTRPTRTQGGTEYYNPQNRNESIRVMQGRPGSRYPNSRAPYGRQRDASGTYLRWDGTRSPEPRGGLFDPDAHIPLDEFQVRP